MADIADPDDLTLGTEVTLDFASKLIDFPNAGNLIDPTDGILWWAFYSWLEITWKDNPAAIGYSHPAPLPFFDQQFELVDDWEFANDTARKRMRGGGWAERTAAGVIKQEWAALIGQGTVPGTYTPYYSQGGAAIDMAFPGQVNEPVKIFGDATHGNFDARDNLSLYVRPQGRTYASNSNVLAGYGTLTYRAYNFGLSTSADPKITTDDTTISTTAPYTGITVTYHATDQVRNIGGTDYNFRKIIDCNGARVTEVFEKIQYLLRQDADIDSGAGTVNGKTADALLQFVGDNLYGAEGVYLENFDPQDTALVFMRDEGFVEGTDSFIQFPRTVAVVFSFSAAAIADATARYRLWAQSTYDTASAVLVTDADGNPIDGLVGGNSTISRSFAFDEYSGNGHTPGTTLNVVAEVIGAAENGSQYFRNTGVITSAPSNPVPLLSNTDRVFRNPD